ncbi:MAG: Hsp20/alpha crystallin family protein [Deltaproteobacteria bacterium]|nr:Hsp20/alpha crystallin family protein [Deltaproteobacteria bacterium]
MTEKNLQENNAEQTSENSVALNFFRPAADILETEKDLLLYLDMPGVSKERVEIKLEKDILSIEGRINDQKEERLKPLYREFRTGNYKRSFTLSKAIDQKKIKAKLEEGMLVVTLPKSPDQKPKQILVN